MTQDELKQAVARAAVDYIAPKLYKDDIIGVGTGSTTNFFIDYLADIKDFFAGAVASSSGSADKLHALNIPQLDLNDLDHVDFYIDGADESNGRLELIKGGGAALTREKIIAAAARRFICIADESKLVDCLGRFPLPVEVIPMARNLVALELSRLGGRPVHRTGVVTDNGNHILDVHDLAIEQARDLETRINQITGVVTAGLFAHRPADVLLLGTASGVRRIDRPAG